VTDGRAPRAHAPGAAAFDSIPAAAAVLDGTGRITEVNRAWRLFALLNSGGLDCGIGADYLQVCEAAARSGVPDADVIGRGLRAVLRADRRHFEHEYACDAPHEPRWFLIQAAPLPHGQGAVVTHVDITRRKAMELRLAALVDQDALTGLASRVAIDRALATVQPGGGAVLVCDLDGFKDVNDTYGHLTGDELLVQVAARLRHVADPAVVGRLGGDEFVVVQPAPADHDDLAHRLREALSLPYQLGPRLIEVGCSIGMACALEGEPAHQLLGRADALMYREKVARGRGARRSSGA
jgi:diguanylate cyclase (GGDEF)-like protein